jgi:hypothetical protein
MGLQDLRVFSGSLDELAAFYPAYLGNNLPDITFPFGYDFLDREGRLKISITQFDGITSAFRQFWESFPEMDLCVGFADRLEAARRRITQLDYPRSPGGAR